MTTAIAKTLLHFIWEGTLIAFALALLLHVVRPVSAKVRYGLACTAMLSMLAGFAVTLIHFWPRVQPLPVIRELGWRRFPFTTGALAPAPAIPPDPLWYVTAAWIFGASLFSLRSIASWLAAQRLRRVGVCSAPEHWHKRLQQLAARVRVSRPVTLLESYLTDVPVVLGCLRPAILIPAGMLTGFPAEQVEYFLIHELAHVRRCDYLVNLLQSAAENLLFYHPAVWWVSKIVRAERENCCDDVVASIADARGFASALAALEQVRGTLVQPALAASGGDLMKRVHRLLGRPEPRRSGVAPVLLAVLVVALAAGMAAPQRQVPLMQTSKAPTVAPTLPPQIAPEHPLLVAQAQTKNPPVATPANAVPAQDPYTKWLNEEAVYIISDAERQAFKSLRTDEERQQFIEQFWLRRDPTPGTPQNEMQEEHYRRIAYANQNFTTGNVPGWKTDRGMIYIKYGPPDEKEIHPTGATYDRPGGGTTTTSPFEMWRYRYIQGMGTNVMIDFVADSATGEYHMTMDPSAVPAAALPPAVDQPFFNGGGRGRGAATPNAQDPRTQAVAQFLNGAPTISIRPRAAGTITAVHVTERQFVPAGQPLVDLDSNNPPYNQILSPAAGLVHLGSLKVGQHVEADEEMLQIAARTPRTAEAKSEPLSYREAEAQSLQYQAGFESAFLNLRTNADRNAPAVKALEDASRQLDRAMSSQTASPAEIQAALDRLNTVVANARAARLGSANAQASSSVSLAPWWAADSLDATAMAKAIEVSAKIRPDGTALEVTVTRSNDPSLNRSAMEAVQSWKFPILRGGQDTYAIKVFVNPNRLARR